MKKSLLFVMSLTVALALAGGCCCNEFASLKPAGDVKLKNFYTDNMVFQRDMPIVVCGTAAPGGKVCVELNGSRGRAKVTADGIWKVKLPPQPAGGPYQMTVKGSKQIVLKNIMLGEVWVCSGQSNMEFPVKKVYDAQKEIAAANYPNIRIYKVRKTLAPYGPKADVIGKWKVCSPKTIPNFSAVAYFFGRKLNKDLNVPIGLIDSSWGGTRVEPWISINGFKQHANCSDIVDAIKASLSRGKDKSVNAKYMSLYMKWIQAAKDQNKDKAVAAKDWNAEFLKDEDTWKTMKIPGNIESNAVTMDGTIWFRKTVDIPSAWAGKPIQLSMGLIDDCDETYFNGVKVGAIGPGIQNHWAVKRKYTIPGKLVKAGKNSIAVRVFDEFSSGGLLGPEKIMFLKQGKNKISLAGNWRYKVESVLDLKKLPKRPEPASSITSSQFPSTLYNGMIDPLTALSIRGAIWYQGESNTFAYERYKQLFPLLIKDWRRAWHNPGLVFLFTQLAAFERHTPGKTLPEDYFKKQDPNDPSWARLREAQLQTLSIPNTGMAVSIDIGDPIDIHPRNKQDVGVRLALAAERIAYGIKIPFSGPVYVDMSKANGKIRLKFIQVNGGLVSKGGQLKQFAIAGKDKKFVWANAKIDGDTVVVWSDKVKEPVAVRYGWSKYPEGCNLYNKAGLPASPFRTDNW